MGEHGRQPRVVRRRRREPDEIQPRLERRQAEFGVFLGRQIDDDQAIDAGRLRVGEKTLDAIDIDRVVIAHENERRRLVMRAEIGGERQRLGERRAGLERAQARGLDRRPIGHRIGEGHAELDHVGAGRRQRLQDRERSRKIGIAGHDEGHQRGAALAGEFGKASFDAAGHAGEGANTKTDRAEVEQMLQGGGRHGPLMLRSSPTGLRLEVHFPGALRRRAEGRQWKGIQEPARNVREAVMTPLRHSDRRGCLDQFGNKPFS